MISNNTVLNFQEFDDNGRLLSLIEVIKIFNQDREQHAKYYFKFCPEEYEDYLRTIKRRDGLEEHKSGRLHSDSNANTQENLKICGQETEYFQFELKKIKVQINNKDEKVLLVFTESLSTVIKQ